MFGFRPKPKRFKYQYRYYNPKKEETQRDRIRIKRSHKKYHQGRSVLLYALLLTLVLYIMTVL